MFEITIGEQEFYDEESNTFFTTKPFTVKLAHSLISISKWESIWKKSFFPSRLQPGIMGRNEEISYIECMIIGRVPDHVPGLLHTRHREQIFDYMNDAQTATTIHRMDGSSNSQTVTSELIYSWMVNYNIPFECQQWHINRLIALIEICTIQANSHKKGSKLNAIDSAKYRYELNKARKAAAYDKNNPT